MSRREMREHTFRLLFRKDFHSRDEMEQQIELYKAEREELDDKAAEELTGRIESILKCADELDRKISEAAEGWTTERMGKAELTILRLALYEMLYDEEVPEKVAVNEAVELAKKFGGNEAPAFINGVLAKLIQ